MFTNLYSFFKDLLKARTLFDNLEAHIVAGNPQDAADVERLERGFYDRQKRDTYWGYHNFRE